MFAWRWIGPPWCYRLGVVPSSARRWILWWFLVAHLEYRRLKHVETKRKEEKLLG